MRQSEMQIDGGFQLIAEQTDDGARAQAEIDEAQERAEQADRDQGALFEQESKPGDDKCPACGDTFGHTHVCKGQTPEKPNRCEICGKSYFRLLYCKPGGLAPRPETAGKWHCPTCWNKHVRPCMDQVQNNWRALGV